MKRSGFTLIELLIVLSLLGVLLGALAQVLVDSRVAQEEASRRASLSDALSLFASILSRELYLTGYGVGEGAISIDLGQERVRGAYLCESEMEAYCFGTGRHEFAYWREGGQILWSACDGSPGCALPQGEPVFGGESGVEVVHYRLAYLSGGTWTRANLTSLPQGGIESLAVYVLARVPSRSERQFRPGQGVDWPSGLSLSTLGLDGGTLSGRWVWGERLVLVQTPNLKR
jgi:prepilin-type N-terminal cleavage/methylation domain-containing protein